METNQTLSCSGANGGSFALVYDGRTTHKLDHDATATEVQHALHSLPTLNEGDVRVETLHSAGSGLCGGDALVIAFTTPLGNQPPLEIISSLLKDGAPGGVINIEHTTGTRERLECNGAGFCDKAGNITIEFEATVLTQRLLKLVQVDPSRRRRLRVSSSPPRHRRDARVVSRPRPSRAGTSTDERHLRLRRGLRVGPGLRELRPAAVQHVGLDGAAAVPGIRY